MGLFGISKKSLHAEIKKLNLELSIKKETITDMQAKYDVLKQDKQKLEHELNNLNMEVERLQKLILPENHTIEKLKTQILQLEKERNQLIIEKQENINLQNQVKQLNFIIKDKEDIIKKLDSHIEEQRKNDYETATSYEKFIKNPKFHRTDKEKELSFQFIQQYSSQVTKKINDFEDKYREVFCNYEIEKKYNALKTLLMHIIKLKNIAIQKERAEKSILMICGNICTIQITIVFRIQIW